MRDGPDDSLSALEEKLGYPFGDHEWLTRALTHPSFAREVPEAPNNQRLEFLGDAVLSAIIAGALFAQFPQEREGYLTRARALLTDQPFLAGLAGELGLEAHLRLGEGEETSTSERAREKRLADAFEALVAAVHLDGGDAAARSAVLRWYGDLRSRIETAIENYNPKGRLQEHVQPLHGNDALEYVLLEASGPDHDKRFAVEVRLKGELLGQGRGTSKKAAEEEAARLALQKLEAEA